jgi:hypothetical protein
MTYHLAELLEIDRWYRHWGHDFQKLNDWQTLADIDPIALSIIIIGIVSIANLNIKSIDH